jgi:hypothetical protein
MHADRVALPTAALEQLIKADRDVVNMTVPHPSTYVLATSGIDDDIKLWEPTAVAPTTLAHASTVRVRPLPHTWADMHAPGGGRTSVCGSARRDRPTFGPQCEGMGRCV